MHRVAPAVLLTVLSATLYAVSFPPLGWWPVAWFALVPFFAAIASVSPPRAALLGVLWAVVAAYGVGSWFPGMLVNYFEQPPWVGWLGFLLVAALLAGVYYAAFAAWFSWQTGRRGVSPALVAAAWGLCEYGRASLLVGNPWALSAYSQLDVPRIVQVADLAGPYGIGMLIAAVNAAFTGIVCPALRPRRFGPACAAVGLSIVAVLAYGDWRLRAAPDGTRETRVAVVQGAVERGHRWQPEYRLLGVDRYLELTATARGYSPALILWPEYAVSLYLQEIGPGQRAILDTTSSRPVDLVLGGPYYEFVGGRTIYRNSIFQVRDGRILRRYDKMWLLPIAEAPLGGARSGPVFTPGHEEVLFDTRAGRLGAFVCWEAMFPGVARRLVRDGAELIANLSNDAWFASASASEQHFAMARLRAIEERRWLLRAASTGVSAVVDPRGAVVARADVGVPAALTAKVVASTVVTPYATWGDAWAVFAIVLTAAGARMPQSLLRRTTRAH